EGLVGEAAVHLHGVLARATVDDVAAGPDERVEVAHEPVVAVAERDPLLAGAGSSSVDTIVARATQHGDRPRGRDEDVVVAVVAADGGRRLADTRAADLSRHADAVVAGVAVDGDRHQTSTFDAH